MDGRPPSPSARAADQAAREAYGRLLAWLTARTRDVAAAEDALGEAFARALETWPKSGVPTAPEAWLLTVARNLATDGMRRGGVSSRADATLKILADEAASATRDETIPDERLKLLFVCAHPAIDETVRAPLMLQVVLGLPAERIAATFLVRPATMGQRLSRAKARIKSLGIAFAVPEPDDVETRLDPVLDAIYAAYDVGRWAMAGTDGQETDLTGEAIHLARLVLILCPDSPEAAGLLALMRHCEARNPARLDAQGRFVPLAEQDTVLWDQDGIAQADALLLRAARAGRPGRFQLEAAIQSAHAQRRHGTPVPWAAIVRLYDALMAMTGTIGACVGRAAALGEAQTAGAGLSALDALPADRIMAYQPYWAVRAHLLAGSGRTAEARDAYGQAIALSEDPAIRTFLADRLSDLDPTP